MIRNFFPLLFPEPAAGGGGSGTMLDAGGSGTPAAAGNGAPPAAGGTGAPPGQVISKPFREGWIAPDGKIDKTAYDRLPDTLKPFKDTFAKYDTDEQLLSAFAHSVSLNGKKGLMPLAANASEADKVAFNGRLRELLGVPEKAEGYGVAKPADLADDQWNAPYVDAMVGIMHKYNVPPEAVKELLAEDIKQAQGLRGNADAATLKSVNEAKAEVAQAFGQDVDQKIGLARRMATTLGLDSKDPMVGNNAKLIIALHKAATMISEDKLVQGDGGTGGGGSNDRERARDIVFNKANPMFEAYHNTSHGNHASAVAQVEAFNAAWAKSQPAKR